MNMVDPFDALRLLHDTFNEVISAVDKATAGLSEFERERAMFSVVSAYSLSQEMWLFKADPGKPAFTDWMANGRKTAGDSPYTVYLSVPVSAQHSYRLFGKLGKPTYFGVQIYKQVHGFNAQSAVFSQDDIVADPDGGFEIIVSKERPGDAKNWMPLGDEDFLLMTREYRYDPAKQTPVQISIERIDQNPSQPPSLAERVTKTAEYFRAIVFSTMEIASLLSVNQYAPPDAEIRMPKYGDSLFPTKDTFYDGFFVKLQPGEAIRLTGKLPEKWVYVSFVFYDRWYATPDYPAVRCYLTAKDLVFNDDGTYTIYISSKDPGHPNWIDTGGLYEGQFSYRFMLADSNPKPVVEKVRL
jgi:hypothetical protein